MEKYLEVVITSFASGYNEGTRMGLPAGKAKSLVAAGLARYVKPPVEESPHAEANPEPEAENQGEGAEGKPKRTRARRTKKNPEPEAENQGEDKSDGEQE